MKRTKAFAICMFCLLMQFSNVNAQLQTFFHDGIDRKYLLYLPPGLPENAPLVFVFHGYGGSANEVKNNSGMNEVAATNLFAVVYPQGTKDQWGYNFWQVGYDFHVNEDVDDVDFVDSLAHYLWSTYNLSSENTFCAGMSNGGDFCYLNACQNADVFKAIAPVAGCLMKWIHDTCDLATPLPVFEIHGTDDDITYWDGDIDNSDGWGAYYDIPYTYHFWADANGCTVETIDTLPDIDVTDGSIVVSHKYTGALNTNESWLYEVIGGGHDWPGIWGNMDINSSDEIWDFFSKYKSNPTFVNNTENADQPILFPNPATTVLQIAVNIDYIGKSYRITNAFGQIISTGILTADNMQLEIQSWNPGLYLMHMNESGLVKEFIKN